MVTLGATELLSAWERGLRQTAVERALTLLQAAHPDLEDGRPERLSIGRRDALLLGMRESIFGAQFAAIANCPQCQERIEIIFCADDVRVVDQSLAPTEVAVLEVEGYELRFRLPDSTDLAAIRAGDDAQRARQTLLQRCLLSARRGEGKCPVPASELPEHAISSLEDEMARMDAQSDMQMALDCPSCRNRWSATFDILGFFWNEINAWAQRLLVEVHMLAARYGWREADILEMSADRRSIYLNMAGQ